MREDNVQIDQWQNYFSKKLKEDRREYQQRNIFYQTPRNHIAEITLDKVQ